MTRSLPKIDITSHLPKLFAQTCVVLSGQGVHISYVSLRHKGVFMKMMMMMGKWGKKKSGTTPCRTNTLARYSSSTCLGGDPLRTNRAEKNSRTKGKRAHFSPTAGVVLLAFLTFSPQQQLLSFVPRYLWFPCPVWPITHCRSCARVSAAHFKRS